MRLRELYIKILKCVLHRKYEELTYLQGWHQEDPQVGFDRDCL